MKRPVDARIPLCAFMLCLCLPPLGAQPNEETRRRLIREFEDANRAKQQRSLPPEVQDDPTKAGGLDPLEQEMLAARAAFLNDRSETTRAAVAQTTINYVAPLILLRRYEEAVGQIELAMNLIGRQENLARKKVEIRLEQGDEALGKGDRPAAKGYFEDALKTARNAKASALVDAVGAVLRDSNFDWARLLYHQGKWMGARDKAAEALVWRIEPEPIHGFLARISYQLGEHQRGLEEISLALRGAYREDPNLLRLADLLRKDAYRERNYRRTEMEGLVVSAPSGLALNSRTLERAFTEARAWAARMFGLETAWPVQMVVYQISDYQRICQAPRWSTVTSLGGKIRMRADVARIRLQDMTVIARYAYGLWLADIASEGRAPGWLAEGFAHQLAFPTGPPNGGINDVKRRVSQGKAWSFESLEPAYTVFADYAEAAAAMAQAQTAVQFLIEKEGLGFAGPLLQAVARHGSAEGALREAFGFDYTSLFQGWSERMQRGFLTGPQPDSSTLRSLGIASPLGSYWDK